MCKFVANNKYFIFYVNRDSQYAGARFTAAIAPLGLISGTSRKGICWDNAVSESYFATFKAEEITKGTPESKADIDLFRVSRATRERGGRACRYRQPHSRHLQATANAPVTGLLVSRQLCAETTARGLTGLTHSRSRFPESRGNFSHTRTAARRYGVSQVCRDGGIRAPFSCRRGMRGAFSQEGEADACRVQRETARGEGHQGRTPRVFRRQLPGHCCVVSACRQPAMARSSGAP